MTHLSAPFVAILLLFSSNAIEGQEVRSWRRHAIDAGNRELGKQGADGVRLADVNGDGRPDIVTGWEESGAVVVYLHPGPNDSTNPWPSVTVGTIKGVEDAVFADLDSDGAIDVVTCAEGQENKVSVHWAPTSRKAYLDRSSWNTQTFPASTGYRWMFALPLDVNHDQRMDLVVGAKNKSAIVGWLENPPESRDVNQWQLHAMTECGWIMSLRASDIDGDDDLDIVYSDRRGPTAGVHWLENPGTNSVNWNRHTIGGRDHEVMFLTVDDFGGDERLEIICATLDGVLLHFARSTDGTWDETRIPLPFGLKAGKAVAVADVNLDGRPDLVTTSEAQREHATMISVAWMERSNEAWIAHSISDDHGRKFDRLEMLDLDNDGDLDLLTCEEHDNLGVFWYENPTR